MKKNSKDKNKKTFFFKKYSRPVVELKEVEEDEDENIREVVVEKDNGFNVIEVIVIIFVSVLFGVVVGCILSSSKTFGIAVDSEVQEIISTYENIVENYYDEVDKEELLEAAVSGMISKLDDPYSVYMDSEDTEAFNETVDGSFVGIGTTVEWTDGNFRIIEVLSGSPAEKAGIKVEDYIIKVDKNDVSSLTLDEVSDLIRGKEGTTVNITVQRENEEIDFKIKRGVVEVPSVVSNIFEDNIGYIYISSFASNTSDQFTTAYNELKEKGIKSLIIDVRDNPGGRLGQVNNLLDLFFDKKEILYKIETKGEVENVYAKKADKLSIPVVVIVNHNSASASEILAASFQDNYSKATIVGTVTYGKGTIQKAIELSSGASIKYTTQKWLTPKGKWVNEVGIVPDEVVEQSEEYLYEPSNDNDAQLQKAIEILKK